MDNPAMDLRAHGHKSMAETIIPHDSRCAPVQGRCCETKGAPEQYYFWISGTYQRATVANYEEAGFLISKLLQ